MSRRSSGGVTSSPAIPPLPSNSAQTSRGNKGSVGVKRRVEALFDDEDLSDVGMPPTPPKRKRVSRPTKPPTRLGSETNPYSVNNYEVDHDEAQISTPKSAKGRKRKASEDAVNSAPVEKRQRQHRKKPPQTFLTKLSRARTQRMIVLSRTRTSEISEDVAIVGSTGNIYTVTVDHRPSCTCPDSRKGNECKHKVYALHTVLRAPEHLVYQIGLLSDELKEIFTKAPPIPTDKAAGNGQDGGIDNKRKPFADTECPICYMDMLTTEELVWYKAACGNNMHKSCFDQWVASQRGQTVKCVYCRTLWAVDVSKITQVQAQGYVGDDGYVNVAAQFGMDEDRDYSSYHQPWVRRRYRGYSHDDDDLRLLLMAGGSGNAAIEHGTAWWVQ